MVTAATMADRSMQVDADGGPPALTARALVGVVRYGPHRCRHFTEIPSGHPTTPSIGPVAPILQMRTLGSDRFSVGSRPSAGEDEHEGLGDLAMHLASSLGGFGRTGCPMSPYSGATPSEPGSNRGWGGRGSGGCCHLPQPHTQASSGTREAPGTVQSG